MKSIFSSIIWIIVVQVLSAHISFAQCSVSSNILTENFNSPSGPLTSCSKGGVTNGNRTGDLPAGQTKGDYAASCGSSVLLMDNSHTCRSAGPDSWKTQTSTGRGGGNGNYALFVDACGSVPDGSVWCYSTTVNAGERYNFSAFFSSPWMQEKQNDPDVYFTVQLNGGSKTQLGSTLLVEQYTSSGPTPYQYNCGTYTVPSGTASGSTATFCINLKQRTGGDQNVPGSGTFGANGQGNDILVDDIRIDRVTGSGCGTSGGPCQNTLPVTLLNFTAEKNGNGVNIAWQTATEENNDYFIVEKSQNAVDFISFDKVYGAGNSNNLLSYHTTDPAPYSGVSYYRLKQVDFDGTFAYSKTVKVSSDESKIHIFPNPSNGSVRITVSTESPLYNIEITDVDGRLVYSGMGGQDNPITEISGLSKGIFVVRVLDGSSVTFSKLVVM